MKLGSYSSATTLGCFGWERGGRGDHADRSDGGSGGGDGGGGGGAGAGVRGGARDLAAFMKPEGRERGAHADGSDGRSRGNAGPFWPSHSAMASRWPLKQALC